MSRHKAKIPVPSCGTFDKRNVSDYKDKYYGPVSRERDCGVLHQTIEDAIVHAEQHLGCFRKPMRPYRGTTRENEGVIVGFAVSPRRRWRLDFSNKLGSAGEPAKWVHVNEEDFDAPPGSQRIVHRVASRNFTLVALQYQKWRARYGREPRPP